MYQNVEQIVAVIVMVIVTIIVMWFSWGSGAELVGSAWAGLFDYLSIIGVGTVAAAAATLAVGYAAGYVANVAMQTGAVDAGLQEKVDYKQARKAGVNLTIMSLAAGLMSWAQAANIDTVSEAKIAGEAAMRANDAVGAENAANAISQANQVYAFERVAIETGKQLLQNKGRITSVSGLVEAAFGLDTGAGSLESSVFAGIRLGEQKSRNGKLTGLDWFDFAASAATAIVASESGSSTSAATATPRAGGFDWTNLASQALFTGLRTFVAAKTEGEDAALTALGTGVGQYSGNVLTSYLLGKAGQGVSYVAGQVNRGFEALAGLGNENVDPALAAAGGALSGNAPGGAFAFAAAGLTGMDRALFVANRMREGAIVATGDGPGMVILGGDGAMIEPLSADTTVPPVGPMLQSTTDAFDPLAVFSSRGQQFNVVTGRMEDLSPTSSVVSGPTKASPEQVVHLLELMGGGKSKVGEMQDLLISLDQNITRDEVRGPKTDTAIRAVLLAANPLSPDDYQSLTPEAVAALRNAGERNYYVKGIAKPLANTDVMNHVLRFDYAEWQSTGLQPGKMAENLDALQAAVDAAHKNYPNVSKDTIYGVLARETFGQTNAVSPTGAVGPMQILAANFTGKNGYNPLDPEQGILGGTKMLSDYINKYGSDEAGIAKALTAYNWGFGNVEKAIGAAAANMPSEIDKLLAAATGKPIVEKTWMDYVTTTEAKNYAASINAIRHGSWSIPGYFGTPR